jgi:hypothetical protein
MMLLDNLVPLLLGFLLGCFVIVVGVLLFWVSETSRYRRLHGQRDEHATDYEQVGTRLPER